MTSRFRSKWLSLEGEITANSIDLCTDQMQLAVI